MPLILAHRGAHDPETPGVRENTLDAFTAAASIADGVELDVRRTEAGALVVHHDRLPPVLGDWVPTLAAALDACAGMRMVNVEIKAEPDADPGVPAQVAAAVAGRPNVFVSSFNLVALNAFHAAAPTVPTGWLTMGGYDQDDALAAAAAAGHRALNPPEASTTPALVANAHAAGLQLVVWTVNDADRMAELAALGVDVIVTDRPLLAATRLRSR